MKTASTAKWILAGAMLFAGNAMAKQLSPTEALDRMLGEPTAKKMKKHTAKSKITLAHTFTSENGDPMVYAFNKGDNSGYMLASADDCFPAMLGYGDNGNFDAEKIPASMKWFIEDYAREMDYVLSLNAEAVKTSAIADNGWEPIAPLLKSKWDQGEPYNLLSPPLELIDKTTGSPTGDKIPTVTGCVATSLAQVLYYHQWPDVGTGSHKYEWNAGYSDVAVKQLSCDFSQYRPDWDNMLPTYELDAEGNPTWNDAQAKAVADLMYACGVSVDMNYNIDQAGGSGAVSRMQSYALVDYFKYSKAIRYKYRDYCSSSEFEKIIYDNLKEGLPVLYNGRSSAGGHSFVCDGYAGDHYFHFNWGWSGVSDGYFYLARLNPESLGIGGAGGAAGFNTNQGISYNIRPVKDGNDTGVAEDPYFNCVGNFDYYSRQEQTAANGKKLTFTIFNVTSPVSGYNAGFWNMSSVKFDGYLGVIVKDKDGKETFVVGIEVKDVATNSGYKQIPAYLEEFPEGTYTIYPGYYNTVIDDGDYINVVNGYRNYVTMTVDADGNRTFTNQKLEDEIATAPELAVTCFNYNGEIYSNTPHDFLLTVANHTSDKDYYGDLTMVLKNSKGKVLASKPLGKYDVPAGLTIPYSFNLTLDLLKNDYIVSFKDSYGRELPGEYPLTIAKKGSELTTQLRIMSYSPVDVAPHSIIPSVTFQVGNYGSTAVAAPQFGLAYFKQGESTGKIFTFTYPSLTIESGKAYNLRLTDVNFDLEEGDYVVKMYWFKPSADGGDPTRTLISNPIALRAGYPVESVSLPQDEIILKPGDNSKLTATLTPENATFRILSWTSSNPAVATVDNDGNVTAISEGHAYISATSHNGASDVTKVEVKETSAVSEILSTGGEIISVYNAGGIKILDRPTADEIKALEKGLYIVITDKGSVKLAI